MSLFWPIYWPFPLILHHLSCLTTLSCWCVGVIWYCRWPGNSDGLPRSYVGPHSAAWVGWHRQHVLELSQFPGGGQQWEWHGLWRLLATTRWAVYLYLVVKTKWSQHITINYIVVPVFCFSKSSVTLESKMIKISGSKRSFWLVNSLLVTNPWMERSHTCISNIPHSPTDAMGLFCFFQFVFFVSFSLGCN